MKVVALCLFAVIWLGACATGVSEYEMNVRVLRPTTRALLIFALWLAGVFTLALAFERIR